MRVQQVTQVIMALIGLVAVAAALWRWQETSWATFVWIASQVALLAIRTPYARENRQNTITAKRAVSIEQVLLALVSIFGFFLPLLHLATGLLDFANYAVPNWAIGAGIATLLPTYWLFWRSHADLGRNWSVTLELREGHGLVTSGVYRHVRHPMYTAIWLMYLVQPLLIHNWIAGFGGLAAFALMYVIRVPHEEAMMREEFGQAYADYSTRTGRLWPRRDRAA